MIIEVIIKNNIYNYYFYKEHYISEINSKLILKI